MPFNANDIEPDGYVPGTTALAYVVSIDGDPVGRVHSLSAVARLNASEDPREWIAQRLNDTEASVGPDALRSGLAATLDIG